MRDMENRVFAAMEDIKNYQDKIDRALDKLKLERSTIQKSILMNSNYATDITIRGRERNKSGLNIQGSPSCRYFLLSQSRRA